MWFWRLDFRSWGSWIFERATMFLYKRNSSVAILLLIIHVTMHNYQKSSLAHQVRIIQIFIKAKLYQIGKSVFLFFQLFIKLFLFIKLHLKTLHLSQVVATTSVLIIAICLHKYMKWSNEYLINICISRM